MLFECTFMNLRTTNVHELISTLGVNVCEICKKWFPCYTHF